MTTIRAYGMEDQFIRQSEFTVDENQRAGFPSVVSNRWLAVRLETVGNLITFFACLLAALGRDHLTAGFIGLAVSHAMSVTQVSHVMSPPFLSCNKQIVALMELLHISGCSETERCCSCSL